MLIASLIIVGLIVVFAAFSFYGYRKMTRVPAVPENDKIIHLDKQNFEHQTKNGVSLIDFWADWCVPCKMMIPILNDVATEIGDSAKVCKVDVQSFPDLSTRFGVRGIPTLVLMKNGKEIARFVGVKPKDYLLKQIRQALN